MNVIYIKESEDTRDIIKRIMIKMKKILNIIKIQNINNSFIYELPIFRDCKITKYRLRKLSNRINKLLEKDGSNCIVLSEYLNGKQLLKNYLYIENINILNGRYLFKCLIYKIIKYIFRVKNRAMEFGEVSLLINDFTDINKELIIHIAKSIKRLNVITNHIEKCKKIEEYLYSEFGIILNVSNNTRKSLLESEIIINMDFPEEIINKYRIYDKAILLNVNDKINLNSKRFNGININYYKIKIPDKYILEGFQNEIIYESLLYGKNYKDIYERIIKDKIEINKLIGNNGSITKNEIKTVGAELRLKKIKK